MAREKSCKENNTFTRKPANSFLYKWAPDCHITKDSTGLTSGLPTGCSALAYSQGEDWVTTYCYNFEVINGVQHHYAYVECDYVK